MPETSMTRWERARTAFATCGAPEAAFTAKPRSHDDGPGHGLFLGPIGGPAFSRDLTGRFSRWHLHPGTHLVQDVEPAFLAVHYELGGRHHFRTLRAQAGVRHEVAALFPLSLERLTAPDMPFTVTLTAFSPVLPDEEELAGLPVVVFDVEVHAVPGERLPRVDVALFWPNLAGWCPSWVTTDERGDRAWPGHHHAGNRNGPATVPDAGTAVRQTREVLPGRLAPETCVSVSGEAEEFSRQVEFKTDQNATGVPDHEQAFTLGAVRHAFATTGRLGVTPDGSWPAHWHEPIGSAVAAHLAPGRTSAQVRFAVSMDWPEVTFGSGRTWRRRYAATTRPDATELAGRAHSEADAWLARIDAWHETTSARLTRAGWSREVAGCVINELGLVTSLGTAWIDGANPAPDGLLTDSEHLGLLEGLDEGYYYYDTTDLWHYAFPALSLTWPRLADLVFGDLEEALIGADQRERPVYRVAEHRRMLRAGHLPHDLGSAPEDPFVRLNGYVMRDDPNTWRDATPAHVLARLAHARLTDRELPGESWRRLREALERLDAAVPRHDEFGDTTWDNLALRGHSTYTAALHTGMWAAAAREAERRAEDPGLFLARRDAAAEVLGRLWNGEFFRAASEGKYVDAVMPDSVWGLYYADVCGASTGVALERIQGHLDAAYEICHLGYDGGRVGPLLIGERELRRYDRDGGEELQVNEVLIGSGWMFAAMLRHYGLPAQADHVAGGLREVLYGGSGLQFRTPAAVDRDGHFRAPLNMRPLAAWWLAARTAATTDGTGQQV